MRDFIGIVIIIDSKYCHLCSNWTARQTIVYNSKRGHMKSVEIFQKYRELSVLIQELHKRFFH